MQLRANTAIKHFVKKCFQLRNLLGIVSLFLLYLMVIGTSYDSNQRKQSDKDDPLKVGQLLVKKSPGGDRNEISININNLKLEAVKDLPRVTPHKCIETAALHKGFIHVCFKLQTLI